MVHWEDLFNSFDLNNDCVLHEYVESISRIQQQTFILESQRNLEVCLKSLLGDFVG